jgi:hypothetical protein
VDPVKDHEMVSELSSIVTLLNRSVEGNEGESAGPAHNNFTTDEIGPSPTALTAETLKEYVLPVNRPVALY